VSIITTGSLNRADFTFSVGFARTWVTSCIYTKTCKAVKSVQENTFHLREILCETKSLLKIRAPAKHFTEEHKCNWNEHK